MTDSNNFKFRTKAETLDHLKDHVKTALIPKLNHFTVADWEADRSQVMQDLMRYFNGLIVVVRSSSIVEDTSNQSMAGKFESLLSVPTNDRDALEYAIEAVIRSLPGDKRDRILVQEMTLETQISGVIMTFDLARGAPYYCIEFDDESGRTDVVTSGTGDHKSLYVFRNAELNHIKSPRIRALIVLAKELEELTGRSAIDIEFGMGRENQVYLYQVRPITAAKTWHPIPEHRIERQLHYLEQYINDRSKSRGHLVGDKTILAVMPDWNPAEIIGTAPRPLAASLYKYLITDAVWSRARAVMNYRDIGDVELMVLLGQQPYIDVRCSFNSFLPRGIENSVANRLVNAWIERLTNKPELHDKVEFEIVPTCMDFTFETDFHARYPDLLKQAELDAYAASLTELTRLALIPSEDNTLTRAIESVKQISEIKQLPHTGGTALEHLLNTRWLLQTCRNIGTLQFAVAARHAFIAESLLRSAVRRGAIDQDRIDILKRSIETINGQMLKDFSRVSTGFLDRQVFIENYGHLRPGTYEITSLRYDERGDDLFQNSIEILDIKKDSFTLFEQEHKALEGLLKEAKLDVVPPSVFIEYCRSAIAARENIKFEFSKLLSNALSSLLQWADLHGLSREDISYLTWPDLENSISVPLLEDVERRFLCIAEANASEVQSARALKFAHIISSPKDLYVATMNRSIPNFIGLGEVKGIVRIVEPNSPTSLDLQDCIVCIENADPGFDWLFSKGIGALVTRFGGANSHMAVRCAELGVPAAIGCGDQLFYRIKSAPSAEMNCAARYLRANYV